MSKLFYSLFLLLFLSCNKSKEMSKCPDYIYGTVEDMKGLDGCGFNIRLDNGSLLEPINIDKYPTLMTHNQRIRFTYKEVEDRASICMVGMMVEITCAEVYVEL